MDCTTRYVYRIRDKDPLVGGQRYLRWLAPGDKPGQVWPKWTPDPLADDHADCCHDGRRPMRLDKEAAHNIARLLRAKGCSVVVVRRMVKR